MNQTTQPKQLLTRYVQTMVDALRAAGVRHVVVSPGSRSTPLAYAFAEEPSLNLHRQIDERSAAFFALGLAKAGGEPVVLLCTSGSAAANYFPALTEARLARIPLIAITADRPAELRSVGAPQTIDQSMLYGQQVKWSVDFPLADADPGTLPFIARHVQRLVNAAMSAPAGPVHANVPFREPLMIDFQMKGEGAAPMAASLQAEGRASEEIVRCLQGWLAKERALLVVGECGLNRADFWRFARAAQRPVLADPLSQLRAAVPADCRHLLIDQYDALLRHPAFAQEAAPDVVLRIGAAPVSKSLQQFLARCSAEVFAVVDEAPQFRDPLSRATHHLQIAPGALLQAGLAPLEKTAYGEMWERANDIASTVRRSHEARESDEGALSAALFAHLPDRSALFIGSSMPIRDADTFFQATSRDITLYSNRGTNGIDGVLSSALGAQQALGRPLWLLIGDVSALHDWNGLLAHPAAAPDVTIVLMNNDGGGIFSYLPQGGEQRHFEALFGTPSGVSFAHGAAMHGLQYEAVADREELARALTSQKQTPIRLIEVRTDRLENPKAHRRLWDTIAQKLDER